MDPTHLIVGASLAGVTGIHPSAHEVSLADGSRISYAKLLLTTGSSPRRLPVPGAGLDGVLYLRNVGDSDRIKAAFQSSSRVAVIGAGWIGLETAAAARAAGLAVTVLETAKLPLLRVLGRQVARVFATLHQDGYDEVVFRGDVGKREFIAFWLSGGWVLAGMNVNVWDVNDTIQGLVRAGQPVGKDALQDPERPLESLTGR